MKVGDRVRIRTCRATEVEGHCGEIVAAEIRAGFRKYHVVMDDPNLSPRHTGIGNRDYYILFQQSLELLTEEVPLAEEKPRKEAVPGPNGFYI